MQIFFKNSYGTPLSPAVQRKAVKITPGRRVIIRNAYFPGTLRLRVPEGAEQIAAVSSGVVKIEDNDVLVLVDSAERPEDIDRLRAQHAADAAKEAILQKRSIREYREAHLTLARAIARLHVKSLSEQ